MSNALYEKQCKHCIGYSLCTQCEYHKYGDGCMEHLSYSLGIKDLAEAIKHEIKNGSWQFSRLEPETVDKLMKELLNKKEQ